MKKLFAVAGLVAASAFVSHAQPYYVAGDFNSWNSSGNLMTAGPNSGEYSCTITGGTAGAYGNCKVTDGTWNNSWPGGNVTFLYDSTGSATIHFWPGSPADGWMPVANRVGYDDPNNSLGWGVAGGFDGWTGTQTILASLGNGVYSNNITVTTAASTDNEFKFQSPAGSWTQIYFGTDFVNAGNNAVFTTTNSPQTLPIVLDLPNGRWVVGTPVPAAVPTNYITFQLDLSEQVAFGNFTNTDLNPSDANYGQPVNSVAVAGDFIGWGTGAQLTNYTVLNPSDPNPGLKTNLYIGTFGWQTALYSTSGWKFRVNSLDGGYEQPASTQGQNRTLVVTNANQVLPKLFYDDAGLGDLTLSNITVTFSLYMPAGTLDDAGYAFNPSSGDALYISGSYWSWPTWGYEALPTSQQLTLSSIPNVYTNSFVIPRGTSIYMNYKYSINGLDDENNLNGNANHYRLIRSYGPTYAFPQDVWSWTLTNSVGTNMFNAGLPTSPTNIVEIDFGNLKIGGPVSGQLPITWVGRPAVELQSKSSLTSGSWTSYGGTDSANATNWPAGGSGQFFRLIKN